MLAAALALGSVLTFPGPVARAGTVAAQNIGAAANPAPPPPASAPIDQRLSDERASSRWAYVLDDTTARVTPDAAGRAITRLRRTTEDDTPNLALVLKQRTLPDGAVWVLVRLPRRPNNTVGWVWREDLGDYNAVTTLLRIDRRHFRAAVYRSGRRIWSTRVGVGKSGAVTPAGHFYIRDRLVPTSKDTIYGALAFGTSAYSDTLTDWPGGGVVGIHGTNQPALIPGRISHGCIRMRNRAILRLGHLISLGTPIEIV